ncbi:filamentous hemagglutinin N-terminal domain-containing protein, partial [Campylobacter sp. CNRCH_2015_0814]|uniref:filamentous hemagglutinin N-terminal domain-containing protein n=1 Tax=Campylobacter sp. CNRCH_2015_0814 TaxID=2911606 RepID=UPI0021E69B8F
SGNGHMQINGNGTNSVIQWGGGFSIGQGETVEFGGKDKNYLNIAHGTSKSMIEGILNAGGNNVFLINPNGVIITKTGTINANRFVASTSSMSDGEMTAFANMKTFNDGLSFSPVFKPQKAGNVVNMGNINANNVLLIGNKVSIDGGHINGKHNDNVSGDALKNPSGNTAEKIHLVGNEVNILVDGIKSDSIIASAYVKGSLQQSTTSYYNYGEKGLNFETDEYSNIDKINLGDKKLVTKDKFEKHATIGSDVDWWHFAKGWNENKNSMRDFFSTYKLVDDIDFGGNQGKNYANYCIAPGQCTSMMVGIRNSASFNKIFDGQGFTLKNININITGDNNTPHTFDVGIFAIASGATFKNINVDYMGGGIDVTGLNSAAVGGFIGAVSNSSFEYISINNIKNMNSGKVTTLNLGGFAGIISNGRVNNVTIDKIESIYISNNTAASYVGGFAGDLFDGLYENISLNSIKNIENQTYGVVITGGFAGQSHGQYRNISLNNIGINNAYSHHLFSFAGGFAGVIFDRDSNYDNISLNNIENINSYAAEGVESFAGGFAGQILGDHTFKNIYMYFNEGATINGTMANGKFVGYVGGDSQIQFDNIHIYHHEDDLTNAIADQNYWNDFNNGYVSDKINIHTYNNSNKDEVYKDFQDKANTILKPAFYDPNVTLDTDDIISEDIINQIISELKDKFYAVDINTLSDLLKAYVKIDKDNPASKAEFLANYLLSKDKYPNKEKRLDIARSIVQSLDFLLAYTKNNIDESKLTAEAKDLYSKNR